MATTIFGKTVATSLSEAAATTTALGTAVQLTGTSTPCFKVTVCLAGGAATSTTVGGSNVVHGKGVEIQAKECVDIDVNDASLVYVSSPATSSVKALIYS